MSRLFGTPKVPDPPKIEAPPPVPTIDDAGRAREAQDRLLRRRGRAASVLTGSSGSGLPPTSAAATLGGY